MGKDPSASAGDTCLISGSRGSAGEGNGNPLQTLAWEILWTEEPGRLQSGQGVGHDLVTKQHHRPYMSVYTHIHTHVCVCVCVTACSVL